MPSSCNSLNVQTIKVTQLSNADRAIRNKDFFLLIQSGSASSPGSQYSRKATFGELLSYINKSTGSYSGSFSGSFKGNFTSGKVTGSFLGSLKGNVTGTASRATTASFSRTASYVSGYPSGTGSTDFTTYWVDADTVGGNDYIRRSSTMSSLGGEWPATTGRSVLMRPLSVGTQGALGSGLVGQHLIQFSSSATAGGKVFMYDMGLQNSNNYIRTGANFAIFYSGSFDAGAWSGAGLDAIWRPDTATKTGRYGFVSFGVRQRLVGVGHFPVSSGVNAQLHVHLSGSYGWPEFSYSPSYSTFKPNENVFLVTSGSSYTKLLRVSGSGQMDVRGDIVAFSTFATSDARLKQDIVPIEDAYTKLSLLNPVSFVWEHTNQDDFGLIAQEVEEIFPEFVKDNMDGYKTVKYMSFIPLLIKTIQEQQSIIESLQDRVSTLEEDR